MSSWGNNNDSANVPFWSTMNDGIELAPTSANAALLFANTTANAFVTGETIGVFGVSPAQADVAQVHTGWVMQVVGSGGRAGRVQNEVLVATSSMTGETPSSSFPNTAITITSQPVSASAVHGVGNVVTFSVTASSSNPAAPLNYYWRFNDGVSGWANTAGNTIFSGSTTTTLTANATTTEANTWTVDVVVNATGSGAAAVTSANAVITIL